MHFNAWSRFGEKYRNEQVFIVTGLDKVGEVLEQPKADLLKIRNFGEKSYNELYDKLREYGILPEDLDPDTKEEIDATETDNASEDN